MPEESVLSAVMFQKDNRNTQAHLCYANCGYTANAEENAIKNILRAGLVMLALEVNSVGSLHCEPTK